MKLALIGLLVLSACAQVKRGEFLRSAPVVEYIESDPDAARRASGALLALRACQSAEAQLQSEVAELRQALDECRAARVESERTAGKWDGLRAGAAAFLGAIVAGLLAVTGWRVRKWLGSPV